MDTKSFGLARDLLDLISDTLEDQTQTHRSRVLSILGDMCRAQSIVEANEAGKAEREAQENRSDTVLKATEWSPAIARARALNKGLTEALENHTGYALHTVKGAKVALLHMGKPVCVTMCEGRSIRKSTHTGVIAQSKYTTIATNDNGRLECNRTSCAGTVDWILFALRQLEIMTD